MTLSVPALRPSEAEAALLRWRHAPWAFGQASTLHMRYGWHMNWRMRRSSASLSSGSSDLSWSVKLPDVNLLLYAYDAASAHHVNARRWLEQLLSGTETVGFPLLVLLGFLRLSTRAQVFTAPLKPSEAFDRIERWLAQPCAVLLQPTERHLDLLRGLLEPLGTAGNLTTDAHLAALAIEHGAELCSADGDFARFAGLRWTNPLR
jgi:uncharacterized protein